MHSALCRSGGLLKNLIDNLDGRNGDEWVKILQQVLRRENPFAPPKAQKPAPNFHIFIDDENDDPMLDKLQERFGLSDSDREYYKSLHELIFWSMDRWREGIAILTPYSLGFDEDERITFADLWVKAKQNGLHPCMGSSAARALLQECPQVRIHHDSIRFMSIPKNGRISCIGGREGEPLLFTEEMNVHTECSVNDLWAFQASTGN
ncbi:MAG: hypothetical protein ABIT47_02290 [Candidatus Paceibacterota bacterium]